ncbi:hypothetical protein SAY87_013401 [Trapa incisa]|uniref:BSD domain-containing protein n=1 Tax=Trapa incisa TaxID=236973 RepID=A0AAN7K8N0_9MYRT|nr:hypothetical protein SAY87_013401 [Trapa incisa]
MNFFKSVFSDDPEPSRSESGSSDSEPHSPASSNSNPSSSAWDFGGLIKTLTSKSESVIDTYRRDLQEFGYGLKKEMEVAQGSLGTVGHAIDEFSSQVLKGTAQIISHGKEAILSADLRSEGSPRGSAKSSDGGDQTFQRYSRFNAQVRAIQGDAGTYCDDPEDLDDFVEWKWRFDLKEQGEEMRALSEENDVVRSIYERVVPGTVDHDTFWYRYFYRMHKLKQAENLRASLVRRAISSEDEELSWEVDDDDEGEKYVGGNVVKPKSEDSDNAKKVDCEADQAGELPKGNPGVKEAIDAETTEEEMKATGELPENQGSLDGIEGDKLTNVETGEMTVKSGEAFLKSGHVEMDSVMNRDDSEPRSKVSVVSNEKVESEKPLAAMEEDLGWDDIEDLSSIDDQKLAHGGGPSPNRAELRKRVSAAQEDEDLSWDIEDDESVQA